MRSALTPLVLILAAALPLSAQQQADPLAYLRPLHPIDSVAHYTEIPYRPLRSGEVRTAAFLTEGRAMPFGAVLGPVTPQQVQSSQTGALAMEGMIIGVRAPAGGAYQVGDSILLATTVPAPTGWGLVVTPTGIARVTGNAPHQSLAVVVSVFGPIRDGQLTLPVESFSNPGEVKPVPVTGPNGTVIGSAEPRELAQVGGELFIDVGSQAGMRLGDFVDLRSTPESRLNAADTIEELMAVGQVIHVGERSSTVLLTRVIAPVIPLGTTVVRSATLPD